MNLKEYSGTYTISKSHRLRNTTYFISLGNGDILRITPELLENSSFLGKFPTLHFTYSEPEFGLRSAYMCVGISSTDGDECYLAFENSYEEAQQGIYTGVLITILTLVLAVLVFTSFLMVYRSKKS